MKRSHLNRSIFAAMILSAALPFAAVAETVGGGAPLTSTTTTLKETVGGGAPSDSTSTLKEGIGGGARSATTSSLKETVGGGLTAETESGYFDWFLTLLF